MSEQKKPLHHVWPTAEGAVPCVKCNTAPKLFLIEAGFNWIGCPCSQTEPHGGRVDESFDNWEKINKSR